MTKTTATSLPEYKTACEGKLNDPTKHPSAIYCGERVYFCTRACLHVFEQNPAAFMSGEVEHPMDDEQFPSDCAPSPT